jgi:hypothetical protein
MGQIGKLNYGRGRDKMGEIYLNMVKSLFIELDLAAGIIYAHTLINGGEDDSFVRAVAGASRYDDWERDKMVLEYLFMVWMYENHARGYV